MMAAQLESLLFEAISHFDVARAGWAKLVADGRYEEARVAYQLLESAWNGFAGAWSRLAAEVIEAAEAQG